MKIKEILKEKEFKDFEDAVLKIELSCIGKVNQNDYRYPKNVTTYIDTLKVLDEHTSFDVLYDNYNKAKKNLEALFEKHNTEYGCIYEFERDLFNELKTFVAKQGVLVSNNELPARKLTAEEVEKYEESRRLYIQIIRSIDKAHVDSQLITESLKTMPTEILANYVDKIEKVVDERCKNSNADSIRMAVLYDYLVTMVPFSSGMGDNMVTQKIDINTTRLKGVDKAYSEMPTHLKALGFLENQILVSDAGLNTKDVGFDGFRFFDTNTGTTLLPTTRNLNVTRFENADVKKQSNFVLDEDFADMLITIRKKHCKVLGKRNYYKTVEKVDDDVIVTTKTLFKPIIDKSDLFMYNWRAKLYVDSKMPLGLFCKVKEHNKTKDTFSIALYYFADPNCEQGIQLLRLDKVADTFKGRPACHNLRGNEQLKTTAHIHKYNVVDAVLKNYEKPDSLGKMDIAYNFITPVKPDINSAEELFNNKCGIYDKSLNLKNREKFEQSDPLPVITK